MSKVLSKGLSKTMFSHRNSHTIAAAVIASAGILLASASPSLACYATATPCTEAPMPDAVGPAPAVHNGGRLFNMVPGGSVTFAPPSHRARAHDHAASSPR